jgi:hypothetical protein
MTVNAGDKGDEMDEAAAQSTDRTAVDWPIELTNLAIDLALGAVVTWALMVILSGAHEWYWRVPAPPYWFLAAAVEGFLLVRFGFLRIRAWRRQ